MRPEKAFYEQADAMPDLVYEVCAHRREEPCEKCPAWETHVVDGKEHTLKPGCHALAVETIAMVLEHVAVGKVELPDFLRKGKA